MKKVSIALNALIISVLFGMLPLQALAKETFELITLSETGAICKSCGLYNSDYPAVSSDGRFVVFQSSANDLVQPPHTTNQTNIYLRDQHNGTTELISTPDGTTEGNAFSEKADVSDNGCYVVFSSFASNLVAGDTNNVKDVFLRNRCVLPFTTTRISQLVSGGETSWGNDSADITPDGHYIVYASGNEGVMRYNVLTDTTEALTTTSETSTKKTGNHPSISDDGLRVAFHSYWPLLNSDSNGVWDAYLWDEATGLSLVSTTKAGEQRNQGNESSSRIIEPAISGDGRYVSFATTADNLVSPDVGGFQDVFVKDTETGDLNMGSITSAGVQGNGDSPTEQGGRAALSKTGYWIAYETNAKNLTGNAPSNVTVLHNMMTGETIAPDNTPRFGHGKRPAISGDKYGRFTAFFSSSHLDTQAGHDSAGIFLYDRHKLPVAIANIDPSTTQPIDLSAVVTLDGSSSNNDLNATYFFPDTAPELTYTWTQTEGNTVTFSDPHTAKPTFIASAEGIYKFQLVVSDTVEESAPSYVTVIVGTGTINQKPIANAGTDQSTAANTLVTLDGSQSSDPDNLPQPLTFAWTQISGQAVTLIDANTAAPSFTPNATGSYSFRLVVYDGSDYSVPDVVTITVTDAVSGFVAKAGSDGSWSIGKSFKLDGRASYDASSGSSKGLKYKWSIVSSPIHSITGNAANFKLQGATSARPSFIPPLPGDYVFQLIVSKKGGVSSEPSLVTIRVDGDITVTSPVEGDIWTIGSQTPVTVSWNYSGIPSNKKFTSAVITGDGACTNGCVLKKNIKPGTQTSQSFDYSLTGATATKLIGQNAVVVVCIPNIGKNDPVCGLSGLFSLQ